ncbi:winged helix-turn-helix transcriptional regulator [Paenibacillus radicis (ex Gao et al. 2016)]|uniref:HTH-type transcriptional activator HxlR n=1 Tax=Paenibacillus radicis (ex Gao et al. 2016) TaxID=1737354 RepID=A0A917H5J3_9BACL|nr:helix-turn-helix domain-containing protein [Paenibacillus radicis (ex Gao et al. 2016)]GGG68236.1 HTH-type transcriptional activator HxlR [Paenibacillus radicis (ex Gao et al. 2016)]
MDSTMASCGDNTALARSVLKILEGKWTFHVLAQLSKKQPLRFNELRRQLGNMNTKGLTDTLRHLEKNEIIDREVFPTVPVSVQYSLTPKGLEMLVVLAAMKQWGQKWLS